MSTSQPQSTIPDIPPSIVDMTCPYYEMTHDQRGLAIILNHFTFDSSEIGDRHGTEKDRERLIKTFHELGFKVKVYDDLKLEDIDAKLKKGNVL